MKDSNCEVYRLRTFSNKVIEISDDDDDDDDRNVDPITNVSHPLSDRDLKTPTPAKVNVYVNFCHAFSLFNRFS